MTTAIKKVAIITGASRGIGAGLAASFADDGYEVVGTARSMPAGAEVDLVAVSGDITDPATADRVVEAALNNFGRIDSLINNAGLFIGKPFTDYTVEDFEAMTAVNLRGFFHLTQRVLPVMVGQGSGHVVNVSTSLVDNPDSERPAALASLTKGGLVAATRALAIEFASRGVRVNAVSLGVIRTPLNDPASYDGLDRIHPLGRIGEIDDVVAGIRYLEQATFVTGETLHLDGGQAAGH
jgi:NAD(P)-dependent dehydrogenase (short-subunit alcohol dehydrogenase family)